MHSTGHPVLRRSTEVNWDQMRSMTFADFFRVLLLSKVIWGADFDSDIHFALRRLEMKSWSHRVVKGQWRHMTRKWFFDFFLPLKIIHVHSISNVTCYSCRKEHAEHWNFALAPLTRALVGGGAIFSPPSSFFAISRILMRRSSRNFQYPLVHQFYAWCQKENIVSMIGWLLMTSEWRHVLSIQTKNKGLRETPWHIHVCRYNRSVFAKRLRIIRAIRLLSRNFEFFKILKIVKINNKKFSFVFFFLKKIIFSKKPEYMWKYNSR